MNTEKYYNMVRNGKMKRKTYDNKLLEAYMKAINIEGSVFMEILALNAVKALYGDAV
jgi:hypothetical protein